MRSLSNILRRADARPAQASDAGVVCRSARADEIHTALRLVLASDGKLADNQHVLDFLSFAHQRNIDPADVWLAERDDLLLWAVLPILSPGRTMLLLAPADPPSPAAAPAAGKLLDAVCAHHAGRNLQLAQVLLDPGADANRRLFEAHGFARMAELIYLNAAVRRTMQAPPPPPGLALLPYGSRTHALFAEAILASYRDSLDCPGLNGVRDIEDVLAGHKASGEFDPANWFVLIERDHASGRDLPRGVLLVSRLPNTDAAELVYLGIAPESRGRGLGEWPLRKALATAAAAGLTRLSLAVDSNNVPALKLYYRFGMARIGSKVAMMRRLQPDANHATPG